MYALVAAYAVPLVYNLYQSLAEASGPPLPPSITDYTGNYFNPGLGGEYNATVAYAGGAFLLTMGPLYVNQAMNWIGGDLLQVLNFR